MWLLNLCSCKALPFYLQVVSLKRSLSLRCASLHKAAPRAVRVSLNFELAFCCRVNFCSVLQCSLEQHWQLCAAAAIAFPSEAWMTVDPHRESFRSSILPLFTVHREKVEYTVVRRVSTSCINGTSFQASSMCLWLPQHSNYFSSELEAWGIPTFNQSTVLNYFCFVACFAEQPFLTRKEKNITQSHFFFFCLQYYKSYSILNHGISVISE